MRFARSILAILAIAFMAVVSVVTTTAAMAAPVTRPVVHAVVNYHSHPLAGTYIKEVRDTIAKAVSRTYTVRPGDYLSSIAAQMYGHSQYWPGIYNANKAHIANPNLIYVGQHFVIPGTPSTTASVPKPIISGDQPPTNPTPPTGSSTYTVSTSFQRCVIQRESGGNPQIWNGSGHWGLYQFSESTWEAHGGAASLFGHAGAAYQTVIFWNTVRVDGGSDWSPYDGCVYDGTVITASAVQPIKNPPVKPPTSNSGSLEYRAMKKALTRIGAPYVWAAAGPWAFDCSGLVVWSYGQLGVYEPHFTGDLWNRGFHVSRSQLIPGDLVFFYGGHSHVGIYIGNGKMVDAPHTGTDVQIQSVDWSNYVGAVRL